VKLDKAPLGVLSAFALKVLGRNPPEFADQLVGVVDLYDQYLLNQELQRVQTNMILVAATTSIAASLPVPAGRVWRVLAVGTSGNNNVADGALLYDLLVQVVPPTAAASVALGSFEINGSSTVKGGGFYLGRPLVIPAGWALSFFFTTRAAAPANNVNMTAQALVHEFDI